MTRNIDRRVEELEKASWFQQKKGLLCVRPVEAPAGRPLPPGELLGYHITGGGYIDRRVGESLKAVYERACQAALAEIGASSKGALMIEDLAPHGAPSRFKLTPQEAYMQMLNG